MTGWTDDDLSTGARGTDDTFDRLLRGVAAAPSRMPTVQLDDGDTVNGFLIEGRLGSGAMGIVYRARDLQLDRPVALKLLSGAPDERTVERLRREAETMAQLSHANIVTIFDVGTHDGALFIVMELIDGGALTAWLADAPRPWVDVLDKFIPAGRGLAAAHALGIVHRDFKPDNVLVCRDGRTAVADFGVATPAVHRSVSQSDARADEADAPSGSVSNPAGRLTRDGEIIGTPAYMAPEQFDGLEVTASADQFAFCVSLYEALYGQLPFPTDSVSALRTAAASGQIQTPDTATVPRWLRRVVLRGLNAAPAKRWPSMAELVAALDRGARRSPGRRIAAWSAATAAIAAGAWAVTRDPGPNCESGPSQLATVYGPEHRAAIAATFGDSTLPHASTALETTLGALDDYAEAWALSYRGACEAGARASTPSSEVLDLQMRCLAERFDALDNVSGLLATADDEVINNADTLARSLPSVEVCDDGVALQQQIPPPADEATAKSVVLARRELTRLTALTDAGRHIAATTATDDLVARANTIAYAPLQVDVDRLRARLFKLAAQQQEAAALYEVALWRAVEIGYRSRIPELALQSAFAIVKAHGDPDKADQMLGLAKSHRAEARTPGFDAKLAWFDGMVAHAARDYVAASQHYARQLKLAAEALPEDDSVVLDAHSNLGSMQDALGHYDQARPHHETALSAGIARWGATHPTLASYERNLAIHYARQEDITHALPHFEQAVVILELSGLGTKALSQAQQNLAQAYAQAGRSTDAAAAVERGLRQMRAADMVDTVDYARMLLFGARASTGTPACEEHLAPLVRAQSVAEKADGEQSQVATLILIFRAKCYATLKRYDEAIATGARAIATMEAVQAPELMMTYHVQATVLAQAGQPDASLRTIDKGLALARKRGRDKRADGAVLWARRAQTLDALGRTDEALAAARTALDAVAQDTTGSANQERALHDIAELLHTHGHTDEARGIIEGLSSNSGDALRAAREELLARFAGG